MNDQDNSFTKLSNNAVKAIMSAYDYALNVNSKELDIRYLFLAIIKNKDNIVSKAMENINFSSSISFENIDDVPSSSKKSKKDNNIVLSNDFKEVITGAYYLAKKFNHVYVGTEHLFLSIMRQEDNSFVKELKKYGIDYESAYNIIFSYGNYPPGVFLQKDNENNSLIPVESQRAIINTIATNLNKTVKEKGGVEIVGRSEEIDRIIHILSRKSKNNPILIGEAGVGKTFLVEALASRIVNNKVPENLRNFEIWSLDISKLMMSTEMRGELEGKINMVMEEVKSRKNIIIFIDEIHMIFNSSGNASNNDIANILKPHLTSEYLRCIGATTLYEYQRYFEGDAALNRRFLPVKVKELSIDDSVKVLSGVKQDIESFHSIKINEEAIPTSVYLADRFIVDRFLPDKAIDLLEEAATAKNLEDNRYSKKISNLRDSIKNIQEKKEKYLEEQKYLQSMYLREKERVLNQEMINIKSNDLFYGREVMPEDIVKVVSKWTDIPVYNISNSNLAQMKSIDKEIRKEIIGQDNAVTRVVDILKSARAGFRDERRPLGIFLFLGPTGVGKTELAKQVANKYMGSSKSLIQLDMSEYMEAHSVSKFIGSPPGYVGYQEGGRLTESVKNKPYSVVLFDEIEKAHPDVLNILLQVMEEGHLTDSRGRFVNFKNTIIILTSNIGSDLIENSNILGFDIDIEDEEESSVVSEYEKMESQALMKLKEYLLPEFLNRIDDVIIFRSLSKNDALKIVKKLAYESKNKLSKLNINIEYSENFLRYITDRGFSEEFGVRQLKRIFNKNTETTLASYFIDNHFNNDSQIQNKSIIMDYDLNNKVVLINSK